MPTSMLSGRSISTIRRLQKDLFATGFAMADPPISITFSRWDFDAEDWVDLAPQSVLLRWRHDKKLIRVYGGLRTPLANSPSELDGMFMAFDPFDVQVGDRFTLNDMLGRIFLVWPSRNGKRRASFTVDSDTRET